MKVSSRILLATLAAAIALPLAAYAAKGDRKNKKDDSLPAFATVVKSNETTISLEEFVAATKEKLGGEDKAKERFATLDKNDDKKLSKEEYEAGASTAKKKRKKNAN